MYQTDVLTLSRLQLLIEYGDLVQSINKRLIATQYRKLKSRDPAELLRRSAIGAFNFARSLGFADDPLDPDANRKRVGKRVYELGSKLYFSPRVRKRQIDETEPDETDEITLRALRVLPETLLGTQEPPFEEIRP